MPAWSNYTLNWFWAYFNGKTSQQEWDAYLRNAREFMNNCLKPSVAIHVIYQSEPLDAVRRDAISNVINTATNAHLIVGNALATDSMFVRSILTAINWIAKKPYPEKVFAHPNDAQPWLFSLNQPHLCAEMFTDLLAKVPPDGRWANMTVTPPPARAPKPAPKPLP